MLSKREREKLKTLGEVRINNKRERIELTVDIKPRWEGLEIGGPYRIDLRPKYFPQVEELSKRFQYPHFHVSTNVCWGDWYKTICEACENDNLFGMAVITIELLENPSYHSSFYEDIKHEYLKQYFEGKLSYEEALEK